MTKPTNRAFFSEWTPESAYVFGFWFADGSMTQPGKDYSVSFVTKDLEHLMRIRQVMQAEQKIYARPDGCYTLAIGSKQMWRDLRLGGAPAKSLVAAMPSVPQTLLRHFIRGYVDGDGYLYWETSQRPKPMIGVVGGHRFLKALACAIDVETGVDVAKVNVYPHKTPFIAYRGVKAKVLGKWLYSNTNLALERKAVIAHQFETWELSKFGWKSQAVMTPKMQSILEMEANFTYARRGPLGHKDSPMSKVFVLDTHKQPLDPVHPGRARILLSAGKAAVYRRFPFTIILKGAVENPKIDPLRIKIDPGANTTGIAIVSDASGEALFAADLHHRGFAITASLTRRRSVRRGRRQRRTRYRKPRFTNRLTHKKGWLPPSLLSRISNVMTWVGRLRRICPIAAISVEVVKFDTQLMEHAEISGVEYQQGTLQGYEVREYLLEKWGRTCAYCDATGVPLQIEHVYPRSHYGESRVGGLTLACALCNGKKGTQEITEFLKEDPVRLAHILVQLKHPLKDAAAVNATRWLLYEQLRAQDLPLETGSGGLTKYNRSTRNLPKEHWIDAACVGRSTPAVSEVNKVLPLHITATGHGCRQRCLMDRFGFPRTNPKQAPRVMGYRTGDIVRAVVHHGKKVGTYVGRVSVRSSGSFNIKTAQGVVQGISHRSCTPIHRSDGYRYEKGVAAFSPVT